jgi:hypothetical protein
MQQDDWWSGAVDLDVQVHAYTTAAGLSASATARHTARC